MWMAFFWLLLTLLPLLALERWLRRHLYGLGLLLSGSPEIAEFVYFLLLLPGILVHELSHWLIAWALGVRTGRISIWPRRQRDGRLRLGYIETEATGPVREALIGVAPLVSGVALILLIGEHALGIAGIGSALVAGDLGGLLRRLAAAAQAPDVWLWLYLVFALANAMLPSPADRRAWPVGILVGLGLAALLGLAGLANRLAEWADLALRSLAAAFILAIAADVVVGLAIWLAWALLVRALRRGVEYF
ncbi:MAG: hypothetical protein C4311_01235 [Chloroflexota bacterium]